MKHLLIITSLTFLIWACSAKKGIVKVEKNQNAVTQTDGMEYGMETFDSKFESWYSAHYKPAMYRPQSYYENWNRLYVSAWNKHSNEKRNSFFERIVGYRETENYGLELNHKLFYYFQYVENVLKIQIMPNGPKAITFYP